MSKPGMRSLLTRTHRGCCFKLFCATPNEGNTRRFFSHTARHQQQLSESPNVDLRPGFTAITRKEVQNPDKPRKQPVKRGPSASTDIIDWTPNSTAVTISFAREQHVFPNLWLRDHCPCPECTHPQTKQRQIDTFDIDPKIKASAVNVSATGLEIHWSQPEHVSNFTWSWLQRNAPLNRRPLVRERTEHINPSIPSIFPSVDFRSIMETNAGLHKYLKNIQRYGLCFAKSTPPTPEATQALLERIAFIRPTQYGGFWDFTSIANPTDTAYTTLPLSAHTDTTYFTDPAGLQMFHMLSHTEGSGGESIFVDGLAAARYLYKLDPIAYNVLSVFPVVSHASGDFKAGLINNTAAKFEGYPVFSHHVYYKSQRTPWHLSQIRWNNDDRSPATGFKSAEALEAWYAAAKLWSQILKKPQFEITVQLVPGTPVIFDNWRVLHGRRAFTGKRRVCGGYIGMDEFMARSRGVERELKEAGESIIA